MINKIVTALILTIILGSILYGVENIRLKYIKAESSKVETNQVNVKTESIKVESINDFNISVVPQKMSVEEKKQRFRDLVIPAVLKVYADLQNQYDETKRAVDSGNIDAKIEKLMQFYSAKNPQDLLTRMKPHARSVAIAQAAMESSWATSRFTTEANNLFGVWSFNKDEPRVAAGEKRGKTTIYVKKYSSIESSIRDYYKVLATGKSYAAFRAVKMKSNNPYELVKKLDKYSEKGAEYGKELDSMIKFNRFYKFF